MRMRMHILYLLLFTLIATPHLQLHGSEQNSSWPRWTTCWAVGATITTGLTLFAAYNWRKSSLAYEEHAKRLQKYHDEAVREKDELRRTSESTIHDLKTQLAGSVVSPKSAAIILKERAFKAIQEGRIDYFDEGTCNDRDRVDRAYQNRQGRTILHLSLLHNQTEIFRRLICGANKTVNAVDNFNTTPLHIAAALGQSEEVGLLIAKNVHLNAQTNYNPNANMQVGGMTALMYAACWGYGTIVQKLLDAKADMTIKNGHGHTALELAHNKGHSYCAQLIEPFRPGVANEPTKENFGFGAGVMQQPTKSLGGQRNPSSVKSSDFWSRLAAFEERTRDSESQ